MYVNITKCFDELYIPGSRADGIISDSLLIEIHEEEDYGFISCYIPSINKNIKEDEEGRLYFVIECKKQYSEFIDGMYTDREITHEKKIIAYLSKESDWIRDVLAFIEKYASFYNPPLYDCLEDEIIRFTTQ